MARLLGELIAVSCGAGQRIAFSAGCDEYFRSEKHRIVIAVNALDGLVGYQKPVDLFLFKTNAGIFGKSNKSIYDIHRFVRKREHAIASFHLQRDTQLLQKRHHALRRKLMNRAKQKLAVAADMLQKNFFCAVVCHIAAAFSGNHYLAGHAGIFSIT